MSDPSCYGSLQVCALRVAVLGTNGVPTAGADNGYVTHSLITVDVGIELSDGDDLEKKNGCGAICQTFKDCDRIKRANLGIALCELDVQLASLLVGGSLFAKTGAPGAGDTIGWELPAIADDCPNGVCFEVWTKAWDGSQQATPDALSNAAAYWHWVFPRAKFQLSDMTMENDFLEFSLDGFGEENANMSADGPFGDWPADIASAGGIVTVGGVFLDDTLPDAACAFIEVPAQGS